MHMEGHIHGGIYTQMNIHSEDIHIEWNLHEGTSTRRYLHMEDYAHKET